MTDIPAPLDAYATAKPDEPTWTVQGGDPLAAPLLRLWASAARIRAGLPASIFHDVDLLKIACQTQTETPRETESLLIRATATEEISWSMDAYRKGQVLEPASTDEPPTEKHALDLHDCRVAAARVMSQSYSLIEEERLRLIKLDWLKPDSELDNALKAVFLSLRSIHNKIEPRRMMRVS